MPQPFPLFLVALVAPVALAQEAEPAPPARPQWTLRFEPVAWYVAPEGNVRLPGSAAAGNGDTLTLADVNLDSPRLTPLGEFQLRRGDWRMLASGFAFSSEDRGAVMDEAGQFGDLDFAAGDTLRSSLDVYSFAVGAQYAFHEFESGEIAGGGTRLRSTLLAVGGIRALSAEIRTEPGSGDSTGASGDAFHAHPYAGLRWELELLEDFSLDVTTSLGGLTMGESESWSTDIVVGFQWNPTRHFGGQFGYRQLLMGIEEDEAPTEFAWNGGLAGVYAGMTLRF